MAAQMLHVRSLAHEALAISGLDSVCGAGHGTGARLHAPRHGRLLVREGHTHGDHRAPRHDHYAAVDGCGVGAPTHPDPGATYSVGVACPGACTARAAALSLLPVGAHWGSACYPRETEKTLLRTRSQLQPSRSRRARYSPPHRHSQLWSFPGIWQRDILTSPQTAHLSRACSEFETSSLINRTATAVSARSHCPPGQSAYPQ
jgi:hypothetical protein